jgi:hypothetical protein
MTRLNVTDARCEALFVSGLQRSEAPSAAEVTAAISRAVLRYGVGGCAARMAQDFGDHPEAAVDRMRWVRRVVREVFVVPAAPAAVCGSRRLARAA